LIGAYDGISHAFENTGDSSSPVWTAKPAWNAPDVGRTASPALSDMDGDGDEDLLIGDLNGIFYAFENTGDSSSPVWTAKPAWKAPNVNMYASPALSDLDGDGDEDLLIGDIYGTSYAFENTGLIVDTTAPSITAPTAVSAEATGTLTEVTIGTATATDLVDPTPTITNDAPASYTVGITIVTWTATDDAGNSAKATQTVTVVDTTAPSITAPAAVSAEATGTLTEVTIGTATATDLVDPTPTITNDAPASYTVGVTIVTWTATDDAGNSATATQTVSINYHFIGFLQPIDNIPTINTVKAGSAIPVKFGLGGNQDLLSLHLAIQYQN
jgi:hypothetical protein